MNHHSPDFWFGLAIALSGVAVLAFGVATMRGPPEPGPWDLYVFPGGKQSECSTRAEAVKWTSRQIVGELRAINRATGEHIVWGKSIWRKP